jgi:hypothetical protein
MSSASRPDLFDMKLRAMRRDRAARAGPELFLLERAFEDCLERVTLIGRPFDRALLIGCPDPSWPDRVPAAEVAVVDPGPLFAASAGGTTVIEDAWMPDAAAYDLILALGTLDTVNNLPLALHILRAATMPGGLLIGAMSGGDTLPQLRVAMRSADAIAGAAAPHVHPRIEPAMVAPLLESAGFVKAVIDVDRIQVSYPNLGSLIADLRAMAATNILAERPRTSLGKTGRTAAERTFITGASGDRATEVFEIIHFAGWTPAE